MHHYDNMTKAQLIAALKSQENAKNALAADLERVQKWMERSQSYAQFGIWSWDLQSGVMHLSGQIGALFGYQDKILETTRQDFISAIHPDDRQDVLDHIDICSRCQGNCNCCNETFNIQYRIIKPDNQVRWMHERGGVEKSAHGRPHRILGVVQDITEQKQATQSLRDSEEHFRVFAEHIREMIWISSPNLDKLFYVSNAGAEIFGTNQNNLYLELARWSDMVHPDDAPLVAAALKRQQQGEVDDLEVRIVRPDGKIRWIRVRLFPLKHLQGEYIVSGIVEDVTDRRQESEELLAHMTLQRTNLIREVHHRIKNNLQGVAGLLRQHANDYPEVSLIIDQAIAQVRTVAVVHGLEGQARDGDVMLCEMVPSIVRMVESLMSPHASFNVDINVPQRISIHEQETVPIALILNELIMNAAKHVTPMPLRQRIDITVRWELFPSRAVILISSPGILPEGFDFITATATGTGLELVRSLLPPEGCKLSFSAVSGRVNAELVLFAPCIYNI